MEANTTILSPVEGQNDLLSNTETNASAKAAAEITSRIEEIFSKLQRNMEHNTRIFQEKAQNLLTKIDQAEDQLKRVLAQLDPNQEEVNTSKQEASIALSENSADATLNSLNQ